MSMVIRRPMSSRLAILVLPLWISACGADTHPVWAADTLYVEPDGDGVYALQSWEVFGDRWARRGSDRHYICAVVVELEGTAAEPCDGCDATWTLAGSLLESDCDDAFVTEAQFPTATGLGIGSLDTSLVEDDPWPQQSSGGLIAYDDGALVAHGWAFPQALDQGEAPSATTWDGSQPFVWWPAFAWEVVQAAP